MAEVDQVTGQPLSKVDREKDIEKYGRLNDKKAKADQLRADLDSEQGRTVLNCIQEQLLKRVDHLIENDPECNALKKLIVSMGVNLSIGEKAVQDLMRMLVSKR